MTLDAAAVQRSGIVLVGGRSSRMGRCKALLELGGEPLLCRVGRRLLAACDELVVVAAPADCLEPRLLDEMRAALTRLAGAPARRGAPPLASPRVALLHDAEPHRGPVGGLAVGLAAARGAVAFAAACDTPFLDSRLVEGLLALAEGPELPDAVVPRRAGRLEPLAAVYRTATMAGHFARQLAQADLRAAGRLSSVRLRVVEGDELCALDPDGDALAGVNDPEAFRRAVDRLAALARA